MVKYSNVTISKIIISITDEHMILKIPTNLLSCILYFILIFIFIENMYFEVVSNTFCMSYFVFKYFKNVSYPALLLEYEIVIDQVKNQSDFHEKQI